MVQELELNSKKNITTTKRIRIVCFFRNENKTKSLPGVGNGVGNGVGFGVGAAVAAGGSGVGFGVGGSGVGFGVGFVIWI